MMLLTFWGTVALLLAGALMFVVPPLLRQGAPALPAESPLNPYREQRAGFDAQLAQGALTASQHAQALYELERRVMEEVGDPPQFAAATPNPRLSLASTVAVALLLPAATLALYGLLGKPAALVAPSASSAAEAPHTLSREQMQAMVEGLAEKMKKSPGDSDGWHMLARSFVALGRLPEAAQAYDRATQLAPGNAQLLADYADTLGAVNGRNLQGRPTELIAAALKIDPAHPKALALAGSAAFNRGDFAAAVDFWRTLQAGLPPGSEQGRSIAGSIEQAQAAAAKVPRPGVAGEPPRVDPAAAGPAVIEGNVVVAERLRARLAPGSTLFVFARAVDGERMPLAIVRVAAGSFPYRFTLDDSLAMRPQSRLSTQREVVLGARLSRSGNALPQSGDLSGTLGPVKVGARDVKLVIDEVAP